MKASEFVKKFGVSYATKFLNYDQSILDDICHLDFDQLGELKRLVGSHELVESYGGLGNAKSLINHFKFIKSEHLIPDGLEQAIAEVESCK